MTPADQNPGARQGRCLRRNQRLLKGSEFAHVFAAPRRSADRYFTVLARDNSLERARLGLAVGKKHIRRAVGRNRIKRLVRESFRHHAADLGGQDFVVLSRSNAPVENAVLARSLQRHWERLGEGAVRHEP